ncbi:unnamed protein product [Spodoptera exigua]|nr:unnamed protein product [Spodoptera exigua]
MDVLKDFPEDFAKALKTSFELLKNFNVRYLEENHSFVEKYWRFSYIFVTISIHVFSLGFHMPELLTEDEMTQFAYLIPSILVTIHATSSSSSSSSAYKCLLLSKDVFLYGEVFLLVSLYTGTALIMISCCALLGAEFLMLKDDLARVKPESCGTISNTDELDENYNINKDLPIEEFVKKHQKLLEVQALETQLMKIYGTKAADAIRWQYILSLKYRKRDKPRKRRRDHLDAFRRDWWTRSTDREVWKRDGEAFAQQRDIT